MNREDWEEKRRDVVADAILDGEMDKLIEDLIMQGKFDEMVVLRFWGIPSVKRGLKLLAEGEESRSFLPYETCTEFNKDTNEWCGGKIMRKKLKDGKPAFYECVKCGNRFR